MLAGESGGVFRLRWQDNSITENSFNVRRRVDGGAWTIITTTAADVTTALDSTPPSSGLVEYYVSDSYGLSNIVAMRPGDGDADGIPDSVELANGLDPYDWRDGMADADGDRIPNLWEHQAGTSITSAASKPAPTFIVDPANAANSPTDNIVAYCRIGERSSHTWFALTYLLGYRDVKNYDGSWTEYGNAVRTPIVTGSAPLASPQP